MTNPAEDIELLRAEHEGLERKGRHGSTKGRRVGQRNPNAKLTLAEVREIRALGGKVRQRNLAALYGVSRASISAIVNGKAWSHD